MLAKLHETRTPVFSFYIFKAVYLIVSIPNFATGKKHKMQMNER
jgi:hypothetical protein